MRLTLRGGNLLERLALAANLVPTPAAEAWGGVATSGILVAAVRTGVVARLARSAATADEIAADLTLAPETTRLLLDSLHAAGHVTTTGDAYRLSRRTRRWLDPASATSVTHFVEACSDYFDWWRDLDRVVATGRPVDHHDRPLEDPYWRRYVLGQLDLARLSAAEIARALRLPKSANRLLDVGGAHGWYSAELCRLHPGLQATVLDLPGSARIGREVVEAAGLDDRIAYVEGDARRNPFPDHQDVILCFNVLHHLSESEIPILFSRAHEALNPGGTLAVLDAFAEPRRLRTNPAASHLALFVHLTSGSRIHPPTRLAAWLREAGFTPPERARIHRIPGLALYQARKLE